MRTRVLASKCIPAGNVGGLRAPGLPLHLWGGRGQRPFGSCSVCLRSSSAASAAANTRLGSHPSAPIRSNSNRPPPLHPSHPVTSAYFNTRSAKLPASSSPLAADRPLPVGGRVAVQLRGSDELAASTSVAFSPGTDSIARIALTSALASEGDRSPTTASPAPSRRLCDSHNRRSAGQIEAEASAMDDLVVAAEQTRQRAGAVQKSALA